jgi:hypothetical protein
VQAPKKLERTLVELSPSPTESVPDFPEVQRHPKTTGLTLRWPPEFGAHSYVTVFRATTEPDRPRIVYDGKPRTAIELTQLSLFAGLEKSIPADVFASDGVYAVVLMPLDFSKVGLPVFQAAAGAGVAWLFAVGEVDL